MKVEKVGNLVANLYDKTEYVMHMNLTQAINHGSFLKKNCIEFLKLNKKVG